MTSLHATTRFAAMALTLSVLLVIANAQQRQPERERSARTGTTRVESDRDKKTSPRDDSSQAAGRASKIQGMAVNNGQAGQVAAVKDIVIDVATGRVKYAALLFGGLAGLGDKLFAVPWDAFEYRRDAESDEAVLVLDIEEQRLRSAPGFPQDDWPDFADPKFASEIENHDGKHRGTVDVKTGGDPPSDEARAAKKQGLTLRASQIIGMEIKDAHANKLGSVKDLVISINNGTVRYATLSYGGLFGFGDKLFAVPWHALACKYDVSQREPYFVLDIEESILRKAPGFNQDDWPDFADQAWTKQIDKYYDHSPRPVRQHRSGATGANRDKRSGQTGQAQQTERGKYIVHDVAMCIQCHTPRDDQGRLDRSRLLAGATMPVESPYSGQAWAFAAPKLAGLPAGWREDELVRFLETGEMPGGGSARPPMPPFRLSEKDATAVVAYLKSLAGQTTP